MEVTWKLRPNVRWHDGAPFSADDLTFTLDVVRDPDLAVLRDRTYEAIEGLDVPDARTVVVRWSRPYIEADQLFSSVFSDLAVPMPRHLLERAFRDDPASFLDLPYWNAEFVGTGPFKVREWERGSYITLDANDDYTLGRPKLDEIEVRFITDDNTLIANILSGQVALTLGRGPSIEQALQVQEQWRDGRADFQALDSWLLLYPQFLNPTPPIVADPQFRRALISAIDRQQLVDSIEAGQTVVAPSPISPHYAGYTDIDPSIVKYPYDPQRAAQMLEGLGLTRDSAGMLRDAAGQRLSVGIQVTTVLDVQPKSAYPVADFWQRVGVGVDIDVVPPQRGQDLRYRAEFPSFALQRQPVNERMLIRIDGSQARTPERGYTGINNARYVNPDVDALLARVETTIPVRERNAAIAQLVHRITDEQIWMGLFFDTEPALIANSLANVTAKHDESRETWNAHLWDVKS